MPKNPKAPSQKKSDFVSTQVRPEVLVLLRQVEDLFEQKHQVRPTHSITFVNALQAYKARLLAA